GGLAVSDRAARASARSPFRFDAGPDRAGRKFSLVLRRGGCRGWRRDRRPGDSLRLLPIPDRRDAAYRRFADRTGADYSVRWQCDRTPARQTLSVALGAVV